MFIKLTIRMTNEENRSYLCSSVFICVHLWINNLEPCDPHCGDPVCGVASSRDYRGPPEASPCPPRKSLERAGPNARLLMEKVCDIDVGNDAFSYLDAKRAH